MPDTRELPTADLRFEAPASVSESSQSDSEDALRKFEGTAYTGAPVQGLFERIIVDLESTTNPGQLPALMGHDRDKIAGVVSSVDIGQEIKVSGQLSQATEYGGQVAQLSDEGFPWQLSIHVNPSRLEEVQPGQTATVNGREFQGPGLIYRDNTISEVSFTPTGKDSGTSARALADGDDRVSIPLQQGSADMSGQQGNAAGQGNGQGEKTSEQRISELEAQLQQEKEARQEAERKLTEKLQEDRKARVQALFQQLGRDYTDEAAKPYLEMSEDAFAIYEADLKASVGTTGGGGQEGGQGNGPGDELFQETATGEGGEQLSQGQADSNLVETMAKA